MSIAWPDIAPLPHLGIVFDDLNVPDMSDLLPCEWGKLGGHDDAACDHAAEWVLYRNCCMEKALVVLYCTKHKDHVLEDGTLVCAFCKKFWTPGRTFFSLIEPLNRRGDR